MGEDEGKIKCRWISSVGRGEVGGADGGGGEEESKEWGIEQESRHGGGRIQYG